MLLHFTKMEGCGNDYIYINGFEEKVPDEQKPALARRLSDRHFGIGGDGLIFINPGRTAPFEMEMYNRDGSRGAMCGNGMRCVAKYLYDSRMTDRKEFLIESFGRARAVRVFPGRTDWRRRSLSIWARRRWSPPGFRSFGTTGRGRASLSSQSRLWCWGKTGTLPVSPWAIRTQW